MLTLNAVRVLLSMLHDWWFSLESRNRKTNLLAVIVWLTVVATSATAGTITDISVSAYLEADCGLGVPNDPMNAMQTGVSSIAISVCSPVDGGGASVTATPTTFTGSAPDIWGALMTANGASQLTLDLPANTFGYVELTFTSTYYAGTIPSAGSSSVSMSIAGPDGLSENSLIKVVPYNQTTSGIVTSEDFLTGASPSEYTIGSNWQLQAESTETMYVDYSYTYDATFVPVPEPGTSVLPFLSLVVLVIKAVLAREAAC